VTANLTEKNSVFLWLIVILDSCCIANQLILLGPHKGPRIPGSGIIYKAVRGKET